MSWQGWERSRTSTRPVSSPCPLAPPQPAGARCGASLTPGPPLPAAGPAQEPPRPPPARRRWPQFSSGWGAGGRPALGDTAHVLGKLRQSRAPSAGFWQVPGPLPCPWPGPQGWPSTTRGPTAGPCGSGTGAGSVPCIPPTPWARRTGRDGVPAAPAGPRRVGGVWLRVHACVQRELAWASVRTCRTSRASRLRLCGQRELPPQPPSPPTLAGKGLVSAGEGPPRSKPVSQALEKLEGHRGEPGL